MRFIIFFILLFTFSFNVNAQTDTEAVRFKVLESKNSFADISAGFNTRYGLKNATDISFNNLAGFKNINNLFFVTSSTDISTKNSNTDLYAFGHARYTLQLFKMLSADFFSQMEYDDFNIVQRRYLWGVGPRLKITSTPSLFMAYGTSFMPEKNVLPPDSTYSNKELDFIRWNNYFTLLLNIDQSVLIQNTSYFQPAFSDFTNIRFLNSFSFEVKNNNNISTIIFFTYRSENVIPNTTYFETMAGKILLKLSL